MSKETGWALNEMSEPTRNGVPLAIAPEIIVENSSVQALHLKYRQKQNLRNYEK